MNKKLFLASIFSLLAGQLFGGTYSFENSTISSKSTCLKSDVFINQNSTIEGTALVDIECKKLMGNGIFKGSVVVIIAEECPFTGTIECSKECVLITDTPQSELKFVFQGSGTLTVKKMSDLKQ